MAAPRDPGDWNMSTRDTVLTCLLAVAIAVAVFGGLMFLGCQAVEMIRRDGPAE